MSVFCPACDNLLMPGSVLTCTSCNTQFPVEPANNLIGEYSKPAARSRYVTMLSGSNKDPAISKIYQKCASCSSQVSYALLGDNEDAVFLCNCQTAPVFDMKDNLLISPTIFETSIPTAATKKTPTKTKK